MRKTENIINRTGINKTECKKTGHSKENKIPGVKCTPKIELYLSNFKGALHWWNGSLFFLIIILGITLGIFAGCKNIFVPEPPATPEAAGPGGGITVSLRLFTGSARTVMPGMESLTWEITASQGDITISVADGAYPKFSLSLPVSGTWTFTVRGINSANDEIFTGSAEQNIESGSTTSISIPLSPGSGMTDSGAKGNLKLTIKPENVLTMALRYRVDGGNWWDCTLMSGWDPDQGTYWTPYSIKDSNLLVGQHTLDLYFDGGSGFYFCTVAVNIWPGMTSDQWIKTNGEEYITDGGEFVITEEMVNEFVKTMGSVVFVDEDVDANTPGTGSIYAPVNSVSTAVEILRKANPDRKCNGTIMVSGATTIEDEIDVNFGETLTIKGMVENASIKNDKGRVFKITGGSLTLGENITLTGTVTNGNGGAVYVNGGTFTMKAGSKITGSHTAGNGGAVYVNGGAFTMESGSKITGSSASSGGGVYVADGSFTMNGSAKLQGNKATTHGGGVHIYSDGTFTMNGGTIDGTIGGTAANTAENGGGVFVSRGTFNMNGGTITGNKVTKSGGGVCISGGTFTMSGGAVISGNTATSSGGGVFVSESGDFTMKGGTIGGSGGRNPNSAENGGGVYIFKGTFTMSGDAVISGNKASSSGSSSSGGGVYVSKDGAFTMEGGTIGGHDVASANSSESGGGVCISGGTFTMSDGSILGNNATDRGDGVFVQGGTFTLSGSPNISGNYRLAVENTNNVYLANGKTITIGSGGLNTSARIGVTTATSPAAGTEVQITDTAVDGAESIFIPDAEGCIIMSKEDAVYLADSSSFEVSWDTGSGVQYGSFADAISALNTSSSGGTIILQQDIDDTNNVFGTSNNQPITFSGGKESNPVILDLNGHTINRALGTAQADGTVISVSGALTLKDSTGSGKITGGNNNNSTTSGTWGGGVCVQDGAFFTMEGGNISYNFSEIGGGGVYVCNGGSFTMTGGTIGGSDVNDANKDKIGGGGGVFVNGKFTMSGGTVSSKI